MSERVTLTPWEIAVCELLARLRYDRARAQGRTVKSLTNRRATATDPPERIALDLVGVKGELATAKRLDLYPGVFRTWEEERASGGFDLSYRIGVRTADRRASAKPTNLLVLPDDQGDGRYVQAALVGDGALDLLGWLGGDEAKRDEWRRLDQRSHYLAPVSELRAVDVLRRIVLREGYYGALAEVPL